MNPTTRARSAIMARTSGSMSGCMSDLHNKMMALQQHIILSRVMREANEWGNHLSM